MAVKFSTALINSILSDDNAITALEECHQEFMKNDRAALMSVLITCARFQAIIPDWAVDELFKLEEGIELGEIKDLNDFFGFKAEHQTAILKQIHKERGYQTVLQKLIEHRRLGGSFSTANTPDAMRVVAETTGISVRIVEEIYRENKDMLNNLPRNSKAESVDIVFRGGPELAKLRRRGRQTLED